MNTCLLRLITIALLSAVMSSASAGPMGFAGSWMAMGDLSSNWQETFINYAVTPRDALGVSWTYMRADDQILSRRLREVTYTRLARRWNLAHAQANVWFVGGLGAVRGNFTGTKLMATPGLQADYETTRVYFSALARFYRTGDLNHDYGSVRAGFSFYETDYEETQPWLIVEARRMRNLSDEAEITPMLRLINKDFFIEGGMSSSGQARFNFMYVF